MILDIKKYLPCLDHTDMSEEQKIEYITTVWNFLDAFLTHDLQRRSREQHAADDDLNLLPSPRSLDSKELTNRFAQCANDNAPVHTKGKAHG